MPYLALAMAATALVLPAAGGRTAPAQRAEFKNEEAVRKAIGRLLNGPQRVAASRQIPAGNSACAIRMREIPARDVDRGMIVPRPEASSIDPGIAIPPLLPACPKR